MKDYGNLQGKLSSFSSINNGFGQVVSYNPGEPVLTCFNTLETMSTTAERLEKIERRLTEISTVLFGSEPCECSDPQNNQEPSVKAFAGMAVNSSLNIENLCEIIFKRLTGN